jgi:hypothetical protein
MAVYKGLLCQLSKTQEGKQEGMGRRPDRTTVYSMNYEMRDGTPLESAERCQWRIA